MQELINFASEAPNEDAGEASSGDIDDEGNEDQRARYSFSRVFQSVLWLISRRETPLRYFLQASMLSSEGDNDDSTKEVSVYII